MQFSMTIILASLASGALAGCAGASGCCCYEFNSGVMWIKNGTTQAELEEAIASGAITTV